MINRYISLFIFAISAALLCYADINTDKVMSKISRDTKTYISAEVRAATEQEAYDMAMHQLSARIADYFKIERNSEGMPDAVYLANLSSIYERLSSKIADDRYRVMLYVKKSDLMPINNDGNSVLLTKDERDGYNDKTAETATKSPDEAEVTLTSVNPVLAQLMGISTREQLANSLQTLRKSGKVNGAAAFPVGNANNYYVAVVEGDRVVKIIHYSEGEYKDISTGSRVDMSIFSKCTGYWFTL